MTESVSEALETRQVTMSVPRDFAEVVDLLDSILEKVLTKANLADYLDLIDEFTAAFEGVANVGESVKGQYRDECVAYLTKKMMERLAPGK